MSEFLQRLRRQAKELLALERDLRISSHETIDWAATTVSSNVVGAGVPVERSFLADYFLTTWAEWRTLFERYPRYFGRPPESMPRDCAEAAHLCQHLADRLFQDAALGNVLAATWEEGDGQSNVAAPVDVANGSEAATLYRGLVHNHLRLSALADRETDRNPDDGAWRRCAQVAQRVDARWKTALFEAPTAIRDAVLWHLRHYRHAVLAVSWLNGTVRSTLGRLLHEDRSPGLGTQAALPAFQLRGDRDPELQHVLLRIGQAIAEIGYDNFLEDVTARDFAGGPDTPLGSANVTLVPGPRSDHLSGIVVAVSRGSRSRARLGFPRVMEQLKALLIENKGEVEFVLVLGDSWDSKSFESRHRDDLRKFMPVPFLFLLVGSPDNVLAPVALAGNTLLPTPNRMR